MNNLKSKKYDFSYRQRNFPLVGKDSSKSNWNLILFSMGRWIAEEVAAIAEVRKRAAKELALSPQFPEGKLMW
jgi:hypothetical protein